MLNIEGAERLRGAVLPKRWSALGLDSELLLSSFKRNGSFAFATAVGYSVFESR